MRWQHGTGYTVTGSSRGFTDSRSNNEGITVMLAITKLRRFFLGGILLLYLLGALLVGCAPSVAPTAEEEQALEEMMIINMLVQQQHIINSQSYTGYRMGR